MKIFLCPTDWSEPSRLALRAAVLLARRENAELLLLHVLPRLGTVRGIASVAPLQEAIEEEACARLTSLRAECVPRDVRADSIIRFGDEAAEIHRAALGCDAIAMSTHGRAGWDRWAFGSVARSLLRDAPCPILVVGPAARDGIEEDADTIALSAHEEADWRPWEPGSDAQNVLRHARRPLLVPRP